MQIIRVNGPRMMQRGARGTLRTLGVIACLLAVTGCASVVAHRVVPSVPLDTAASRATFDAYGGTPIVGGNAVQLLLNDEVLTAELAAIKSARRTIDYAQYYYGTGVVGHGMAEALASRCRAGVTANVLLDAVGTLTMSGDDASLMRRSGCHLVSFRPLTLFARHLDNRSHRRILVVDGKTGFTGGAGAGDKWIGNGHLHGHWRDTDVRVEGPVVHELQAAFARSWLETTGVVLSGSAYFPPIPPAGHFSAQVISEAPVRHEVAVYTVFLMVITSAHSYIHITNPYFLPDHTMRAALLAAVKRGVDVTILVPGAIDHRLVREASRAGFGALLRGGVHIEEYHPALLHAKTMVVDGVWAAVGSTNFDNRSFALDTELNLVVYGRGFAEQLEHVFQSDLAWASPVRYRHWRARSLWARFLALLTLPLRREL